MLAVGQRHALAQLAGPAQAVQHAGHGARILPQLGGFAFKAVDFLDDFDGQHDVIIIEIEQRVGVVEQDIGIKDVILFHAVKT